MEQQPLVSVVIPVYNMEAYLEETVRSVQASTYPSLEIILMDDGSKDQSLAVARRLAEEDPRIHVYTQSNGGVAAARNHAISKASGIYIFPLDADDRIVADYIEKAVEVAEKDSSVKCVTCRAEFLEHEAENGNCPDIHVRYWLERICFRPVPCFGSPTGNGLVVTMKQLLPVRIGLFG